MKLKIFLLVILLGCSSYADIDSVFIQHLVRRDAKSNLVLINIRGKGTYRAVCNLGLLNIIYEKYYCIKYKSLFDFLYQVVHNKKPVPEYSEMRKYSRRVYKTKISAEFKRNFSLSINKYMLSETERIRCKLNLSKRMKDELVCVMFAARYYCYIDDHTGYLFFRKWDTVK